MNTRELPPLVTAAQMRAMDDYAIARSGIPSLTLMENAGIGIAQWVYSYLEQQGIVAASIAVLCGPGNNGGDGLVVARKLAESGCQVTIFSVKSREELKGDAKTNADRLANLSVCWRTIKNSDFRTDLARFDLIVDALFGTGFRGPISGHVADLIRSANASEVPIVAVDTPSGLNNDTGELTEPAVHADFTLTLGASKVGQWLWPGRSAVGHLEVVDIGIPDEAVSVVNPTLSIIVHDYVASIMPRRSPDGHKGTFGKALIVGGSEGMSGAVSLAASASLRSGVGLCYAAVPQSLTDAVDVGSTEAVVRPLPEVRRSRCISTRALGDCLRLVSRVDALAIGPGLSTHHETVDFARRLILRCGRPCVVDADGLNACAVDIGCLESKRTTPLVLTPHAAEMSRLLDRPLEQVLADRMAAANAAASRFRCVVVMKGAPTFVADPEGGLYLNPTGNSGMATGGTGDVLTGILVSLLAQGCDALSASLAAVYIHGLSGDFAAEEIGERSLVASDLIAYLPRTFQSIETA